MVLNIERRMYLKNWVYSSRECDSAVGEVNHTIGIIPKKIKVRYGEDVLELKQSWWFFRLFRGLIFNPETFMSFNYYINGEWSGSTKKTAFKPIYALHLSGEMFEIRQHNNNCISLMKNGVQVALYKKSDLTVTEKNAYEVKYDSDISYPMLLLICMFIDVVLYPNGSSLEYVKYEKTYVFKDDYDERTAWEPKN